MGKVFFISLLITIVNYLLLTTMVNIILMGRLSVHITKGTVRKNDMVTKENRIDFQTGLMCAAFSSAYLLRHYGIEARGEVLYQNMPCKMKTGHVYPKGIKKVLSAYGIEATYCMGNLNALKAELNKGNPVIVMIRVRTDKHWLHYVPVVGYDEKYIYLAESMEEYANHRGGYYNRRMKINKFRRLWNTSMLMLPLYKNTFFKTKKKQEDTLSTFIEKYSSAENPVQTTRDFVKEFLNPTPYR